MMKDKIVLITGSTDGIGYQTALELATMGASIIIHGRGIEKCRNTVNRIKSISGNSNIDFLSSDFSSLDNVRSMAGEIQNSYPRIDVLINNAGIFENNLQYSADGFELTVAVNHLSHFLLTNLLTDELKKSKSARIINVSSMVHSRARFDANDIQGLNNYSGYNNYGLSKLYNILFSRKLSGLLSPYNIKVNSLHPGVIGTKLLKVAFNMSGDSWEKGAETSVYLASSEEIKEITGRYFVNKKIANESADARNDEYAEIIWEKSLEMTGLK